MLQAYISPTLVGSRAQTFELFTEFQGRDILSQADARGGEGRAQTFELNSCRLKSSSSSSFSSPRFCLAEYTPVYSSIQKSSRSTKSSSHVRTIFISQLHSIHAACFLKSMGRTYQTSSAPIQRQPHLPCLRSLQSVCLSSLELANRRYAASMYKILRLS